MKELRNDALGVVIRYEIHECRAEFRVRFGTAQDDGSFVYEADNMSSASFDDALRVFDVSIKWDGCSHFNFGEDRDGYLHLCGGRAYAVFTWAIRECMTITARELPTFDTQAACLDSLDGPLLI